MLRILLIFIFLFSLTARAQFLSSTVKQIDKIENNSASDITIDPDNKVLMPYLTEGEILYYNSGIDSLGNGTDGQILSIVGGVLSWINPPSTSPTTTLGDIIYNDGGGAGSDTRLSIGADDQLLTVVSGEPAWANAPISVPTVNKGDISTHDGTNPVALPVGTDGQFIVADSAETEGLKWSDQLQGKLNPVTDFAVGSCPSTWDANAEISTCYFRQVGDQVEIIGLIRLSSAPSGSLNVTLPDSLTVKDQNGASSTFRDNFGQAFLSDQTTGANRTMAYISHSSSSQLGFVAIGSTVVSSTAPFTWADDDEVRYHAFVSVNEYSSGLDAVVTQKTTPKARFGSIVDQAIPNNTSTNITISSTLYSNGITVDEANNKIVITKDGFYQFIPRILLRNTSATQPPNNSRCFSGFTVIAGPNNGKTEGFNGLRLGATVNTTWAFECSNVPVVSQLSAGDEIQFQVEHNFGSNVELIANNYIQVMEQLDTSVITATLDSTKWECQTKYLQNDITTNVDPVADLTFNNLEIGRSYRVFMQARFAGTGSSDNVDLIADHNSALIAVATANVSSGQVFRSNADSFFLASATTLTFRTNSISNATLSGNGGRSETQATLCELPDNYIINSTKFN